MLPRGRIHYDVNYTPHRSFLLDLDIFREQKVKCLMQTFKKYFMNRKPPEIILRSKSYFGIKTFERCYLYKKYLEIKSLKDIFRLKPFWRYFWNEEL